MIVGCYSLHLYCDARAVPGCVAVRDSGLDQPVEFFAERGEDCRRDARDAGWRLSLTRGTAVCPACVTAGKSPFDVEPMTPGAPAAPPTTPAPGSGALSDAKALTAEADRLLTEYARQTGTTFIGRAGEEG